MPPLMLLLLIHNFLVQPRMQLCPNRQSMYGIVEALKPMQFYAFPVNRLFADTNILSASDHDLGTILSSYFHHLIC